MMKRKILILGATGMLGHVVYYYLSSTRQYDLATIVYRNKLTEDCQVLDAMDGERLFELIRSLQPNVIVNCVGALIKEANEDPMRGVFLNAYLPHTLAKVSDEIQCKLIHISTDCVFSGARGQYSELDFKDADDVYGRSKALGEVSYGKHLTLRTSIIGPELKKSGTGLFHWFMNQTGSVNGFTNAFWGGVTTLELAKAIDTAIRHDLFGLMHVTNGEKISKYALLEEIKNTWRRDDINLLKSDGKCVDKSLLKSKQIDFNVPDYGPMLLELKKWMELNAHLYSEIY